MAVHLTPTELADEMQMKRRDVTHEMRRDECAGAQGSDRQDPVRVLPARDAGAGQERRRLAFGHRQMAWPAQPGVPIDFRSQPRIAASCQTKQEERWSQPRVENGGDGRRHRQQDHGRPASARGRKHGPSGPSCTRTPPASGSRRTYDEVGEIVKALSLGLIDLGIEKGDKVSILANTRPEWTYFDFAALSAGATVVPIYQTNSPEECQYVLENSDAVAVIVEDDEQLEKVRAGPRPLPEARARDPDGGHGRRRDLDGGARRARRAAARTRTGRQRWSSVTPRRHLHLHLHLGHHRPAQGLRDLARQLPLDAGHGARGQRARRRGADLPVPAAGALASRC